jgi:glycosyltransferase involved in cell wall biosynthesis
MKIAFLYGSNIENRPIDFKNLWTSCRGLTGSELSCICYAKELAKLGHEVTLFTTKANTDQWEKISIKSLPRLFAECNDYDVVYSWNDPDLLRIVSRNSLRLINQQINDFHHAKPGYDEFIDLYTSPSLPHKDHMVQDSGTDPNKWFIVPNGCNPDLYHNNKVQGRVIYASSPDRGLHHLLNIWDEIHKRVPHAHLRIFYDVHGYVKNMLTMSTEHRKIPHLNEWYNRAYQIDQKIKTLEGVNAIGSVSRERIAKEMSEAQVLAYPCDPVTWTEGFSVTTMEACAAGAIPVITSADAMGYIYGKVAPLIFMPVKWQLKDYTSLVIEALIIKSEETTEIAKAFAEEYRWSKLAIKLETLLKKALAIKGKHA